MWYQNIVITVIGAVTVAGADQFRRWTLRIDRRLGRIEKLLNINGRDYAD